MIQEPLENLLAHHPFASGFEPTVRTYLASCTKHARYEVGQYLFREGSPASCVYLLSSGFVSLEFDLANPGGDIFRVETLGEGDVLGWSALFPPYFWRFDAKVAEPTEALVISGACLRHKLEQDPVLGYAVTRRLLFEVHRRLERARLQQLAAHVAVRAAE